MNIKVTVTDTLMTVSDTDHDRHIDIDITPEWLGFKSLSQEDIKLRFIDPAVDALQSRMGI